MSASGGVVKTKLIMDRSEFSSEWKKAIKELDSRIVGPNLSPIKSEFESLGKTSSQALSNIDNKVSTAQAALGRLGASGAQAGNVVSHGANVGSKGLEAMGIQSGRSTEEIIKNGNRAANSLQTVGVHGRNIGTHVSAGSATGGAALQGMIKHGENAANTLNKVGQSGRNMGSGVAQGSATAEKGLEGVSKSATSASSGVSELGSLLTGVMGGIGAVEIGNALWTGSTQRQFNNAYLSMQLGTEQASKLSEEIHRIVAAVPGDDTFMNTLLIGAAVRKAEISDLEHLGYVAADYLAASQMTGQTQIEAQQDLNAYIMTGTTGEIQRSRVLQGQVDKMEDKATIHERILALDNALKANHFQGLSTMEVMTIKWEVLKGKIQLAATNLGDKFLPHLERGVDYLMELDDKTHGMSTQIGIVAAGAVALGLALGPVVWSAKEVLGSVTGIAEKLTGIGSKKTKVSFDCDTPCPTGGAGGGTGTTGTGGKSGSKGSGILPLVSTGLQTIGGALIGGTVGDALSNYVIGPAFSGISGLLGGSEPFKAYHGILDTIGLGNQDYDVLNYNEQISKNAEQYGLSADKRKQNMSDWGPLGTLKDRIFSSESTKAQGALENVNWLKENVYGKLSGKNLLGGLGGLISGSSPASGIVNYLSNTPGILGTIGQAISPGALFSKLLPGTASAAGTGGKSSIMNDITGKGGLLDFSRFGLKMPEIKWPNSGQILTKITDTIKDHVPQLNWKLPTLGSIGQWVQSKIPSLGWKIPSLGSVGGWVQDKINWVLWNIPSITSVGQWITDKITQLVWNIPGAPEILGIIQGMIPPFSWPWGPGGGTRAANVAGDIGSRASQLLNARGPRGPLTDTVVGTMSARSGVDSGYVSQAMATNFSGVPGFRPIADALSDHLGYQFYYGDGKSDSEVWSSGLCNCFDGAQLLATEAKQGFDLDAGLQNGLWDGTSIAHTWSVIGGQPFDMAAKLLRGQWAPPSGPMSGFDKLMMDIGPGLEWKGYGGHAPGLDPISAITSGGNCFDMTLGVMNMAAAYGLPSEMIWGTYDNNSHVWARVAGRDYDPTRMALASTYSPPPQGPGDSNSGGVHFHEGAIQISGPFVGMDQYRAQIKDIAKEAFEDKARDADRMNFRGS